MLKRFFVGMACLLSAVPAFAQQRINANLGALNQCVILPVSNLGTAIVQVDGTFSGTVTWTVSANGDTYAGIAGSVPSAPSTTATSTTSTGIWSISPLGGVNFLKACMTSYSSGTAIVTLSAAAPGGGGSGGGGGSNAAASATGSAVPSSASYTGFNSGGNLVGASSANPFPVTIISGAGSGGTAIADNAAFTQGTTNETPASGLAAANDADYTTATAGRSTIWQMTTKGHGVIDANQAGTWTVQPGNTANTTPWLFTPYQGGANLLPNAAALANGTANPTTTGIASYNMCFNGTTWDRCPTSTAGAGTTDSNTTRFTLSTNDGLVGSIASPSSEVLSAVLASGAVKSGAIASGAVASGAYASGSIASGAISDGADVTQGAKADAKSAATDTTAVTIMQVLKELSYLAQNPTRPGDAVSQRGVTSAITNTTSTQVIAAVASNYLYINHCTVTNTSATGTLVNLQDGSGGTTIATLAAPAASSTVAGDEAFFGDAGLKVPTLGNGLYAAPVTTSASVIVSCNGYASTVSK